MKGAACEYLHIVAAAGSLQHLRDYVLEAFTNQILALVFQRKVLANSLYQRFPNLRRRFGAKVVSEGLFDYGDQFRIFSRPRKSTSLVRLPLGLGLGGDFLSLVDYISGQVFGCTQEQPVNLFGKVAGSSP